MLVSKRALRSAEAEAHRLREELKQAQQSLALYRSQEDELVAAVVAARVEARGIRSKAEEEARAIVHGARVAAEVATQEAGAQLAATRAEIARLQATKGELAAGVETALAALSAVLPGIAGDSAFERSASAVAPPALGQPPAPPPAARDCTPPVAALRGTEVGIPLGWSDARSTAGSVVRRAAASVAAVVLVVLSAGLYWWHPTAPELPIGRTASAAAASKIASAHVGSHRASPRVAPTADPARSPVSVTLHAVREVWVRVEIDGRQTLSRLLHAGEHFELEAGRDVSVRAGDGAALLVGVDGHPPAAMGQPGVALTRRFGVSRPQTRNPAGTHEAGLNEVRAPRAFQQTTSQPSPGSVPAQATGSLVATNVRPVDGPAVDEHDLLRAHLAYFEALERGDNAQMGRLCAEGFTVSGGPATDGSGLPYEISLNGASVEVRGVGAVVNGVASQRITGSDGQVSRTQPLRFSEVWVKRDGQWQLLNVRFIDAALR